MLSFYNKILTFLAVVYLSNFTVCATNNLCVGGIDIGFQDLYKKGLSGAGQGLAIIEPALSFDSQHPAFKGKNVDFKDVGRCPEVSSGAEDTSRFRYPESVFKFANFWNCSDHGQEIASILIGQEDPKENFPQGLVPDLSLSLISCSHMSTWDVRGWIPNSSPIAASTALYSFKESGCFTNLMSSCVAVDPAEFDSILEKK